MMSLMSKKKILVIDDEVFIRELVKDFLEMEDIQSDGAETSEQGLELITRNSYNLILLDRNLGKGKVEEVIEQIRKIDEDIPIIILTGDSDCDSNYLNQIGAVDVFFKPFQVNEFVRKINKFLEIV
jgi:DNA-binding response OmpR family regulator